MDGQRRRRCWIGTAQRTKTEQSVNTKTKMASVFALVIVAISLWDKANAAPATDFLEPDDLYSRRNLLSNGLALTPPMGWDSWNHFGCSVDAATIQNTVDALVSTGLAALGYEYVIIDDCWGNQTRDAQGNLSPDISKFPSGIKDLANYVHSKGLKLGLYAEAGYITCTKSMPGSLGHELQDALTFAQWGVDLVKYDSCNTDGTSPEERFQKMSNALSQSGRQILFSVCDWGLTNPATWAKPIANSWRTAPNMLPEFDSVVGVADQNNVWSKYGGPGGWNDADMLQVGNGNLTLDESRSHFSIWALMKSPLVIGCDITTASNETLEIFSNKEVIGVNQDPLGVPGKKVDANGDYEVWAGPLSYNRTAVVLWNRSLNISSTITATWEALGFPDGTTIRVRDLWAHAVLPQVYHGNFTSDLILAHGCGMYIFSLLEQPLEIEL